MALCSWNEIAIYSFRGGNDGAFPSAGVVFDPAGNLYGATSRGGSSDNGIVFELTPRDGGWTEEVLHTFTGIGHDGLTPASPLIFDNAGNLYGTTLAGGSFDDGTVYQLVPSASGWTTSTIHDFLGRNGGQGPQGPLLFDPAGQFYGTSSGGGVDGSGTVFQLMFSRGVWDFSVLQSVPGGILNAGPQEALAMDAAGNIYGATYGLGNNRQGSVFKLTPANGGWTYTTLHSFSGGADGANPLSGVILDANGNLYGTTSMGGAQGGNQSNTQGCGVDWEITP